MTMYGMYVAMVFNRTVRVARGVETGRMWDNAYNAKPE